MDTSQLNTKLENPLAERVKLKSAGRSGACCLNNAAPLRHSWFARQRNLAKYLMDTSVNMFFAAKRGSTTTRKVCRSGRLRRFGKSANIRNAYMLMQKHPRNFHACYVLTSLVPRQENIHINHSAMVSNLTNFMPGKSQAFTRSLARRLLLLSLKLAIGSFPSPLLHYLLQRNITNYLPEPNNCLVMCAVRAYGMGTAGTSSLLDS